MENILASLMDYLFGGVVVLSLILLRAVPDTIWIAVIGVGVLYACRSLNPSSQSTS